MEKVPLRIRIHPVVKEFFTSLKGTDVLVLKKNDAISQRIKYFLQLPPRDYKRKHEYDTFITIMLPRFRTNPESQINNVSRNHIDDRKQYFISKEFYNIFKDIFHNYVLAYCRARINDELRGKQKAGILDFCDAYNMTVDNTNYEMLKKSWNRSEQKKLFKKNA